MHIKHIAIRVNDLEKSIHFYETLTQLSLVRRFKADPGEVAFLSHGEDETEIELIYMPEGQNFEGKGLFLCFETDQLEKNHQLALSLNINPSPIQNPGDGTQYFYVYDPNGVSVQLRSFTS